MITDAERAAMAAALTGGTPRTNKGPKDATIRQADAASLDEAFAEAGGGADKDVPGAHSVRGPGARGSIAGIRVGSKEAGGGADVRAMENIRKRRERASKSAANSRGTNIAPQASPQALPPSTPPESAGLEPWEIEARLPPDPMDSLPFVEDGKPPLTYHRETPLPAATMSLETGLKGVGVKDDMLNRAYRRALSALAGLPQGVELVIVRVEKPEAIELVMGLGLLVGKGYAEYDGRYRITDAGWQQYLQEKQ